MLLHAAIIISMVTNGAVAAEQEAHVIPHGPFYYDLSDPEGFALSLIEKKEYYRAWRESVSLFHKGFLTRKQFSIWEGYLLYKGERYDELCSSTKHGIYSIDACISEKKYAMASRLLKEMTFSEELLVKRRLYIDAVRAFPGGDDASLPKDWITLRNRYDSEVKNEALALALGLFPGGGYHYAGMNETGFVATAVVLLTGAFSWVAYSTGHTVTALVGGGITFFFYGGSIVGGCRSTRKYNRNLMRRFENELAGLARLEHDREQLFRRALEGM